MTERANDLDVLASDIRIHVFREAAATARVPQVPDISRALGRSETDVRAALHELAAAKVLILAPNEGDIWAANPFVQCRQASALRQLANSTGESVSGTHSGSRRRSVPTPSSRLPVAIVASP